MITGYDWTHCASKALRGCHDAADRLGRADLEPGVRAVRRRDAERAARRFVARTQYAHWHFDICVEHDGERRKSWSFGVKPDEEDSDYEPGRYLVGYVHADGTIEGLY